MGSVVVSHPDITGYRHAPIAIPMDAVTEPRSPDSDVSTLVLHVGHCPLSPATCCSAFLATTWCLVQSRRVCMQSNSSICSAGDMCTKSHSSWFALTFPGLFPEVAIVVSKVIWEPTPRKLLAMTTGKKTQLDRRNGDYDWRLMIGIFC